jgi:phage anti-repressor protein
MEELIKVRKENGQRLVDGRELHAFLGSKQEFSTWIKKKIAKYDFTLNQDFTTIDNLIKRKGARGASVSTEYSLTLDMAKELSMLEGNEKGKMARRYFIERDKQLASLTDHAPALALEAHTNRPVQIENSKAVNAQQWLIGGPATVAEYNRENCKRVTGKTPTELKEWAKGAGLPSKQRTSGKEVVRAIRPELACRMSVNDSLVRRGVSLNEACDLSAGTTALFSKMLQLGMVPAELGG